MPDYLGKIINTVCVKSNTLYADVYRHTRENNQTVFYKIHSNFIGNIKETFLLLLIEICSF